MEEDGDDYPRSPFWLQSTTNLRLADRYRRRVSSLFFNLGSLVLLLLLAAILFMGFLIPSVVKHTSQNIRPNVVKRSWDWINLVLVLFALAFGFLSRNRNNEDKSFDGYQRTGSNLSNGAPKSNPVTPRQQWYDFPDQANVGLRKHRNSSSYPDLRELSPPISGCHPWRFSDDTLVDNYRVMSSDHYYSRRRSWKELEMPQDSVTKDVIHVDDRFLNRPKEVLYAPPPEQPPPQPSPPPPEMPAPPPAVKKKAKRTYQTLGHSNLEIKKTVTAEPEDPPAPPSPPPVMGSVQEMEQRRSRSSERKRGGGAVTKDFLASFYHKKKKKRQRQRSVDNLDALLHHAEPPPLRFQLPPPSPPPPPPPLPPPPSVFHNLFTSKKEKRKKIPPSTTAYRTPPPPPMAAARASKPTTRKVAVAPRKPPMPAKVHYVNKVDDGSSGGESPLGRIPPPPPPPPFRIPDLKYVVEGDYARLLTTDSSSSGSPEPDEVESPSSDNKKEKRKKIPPSTTAYRTPPPPPMAAARASKPTTRKVAVAPRKPPMPAKVHNFNKVDDGSSGGESPLGRIPPPPPPPPFRIPDLKYVVEGDYARLLTTDSSRSGSPEPDEVESPSSDNNLAKDGEITAASLFCPSPDVDTKADSFIAKFRAGLKLEKIHSFNQKQGLRMSNLGPGQL